jgi:phage/plasmid-like protein (TIGR03299 family)
MAHELHIEDGRASMMYVGREPWHGLGTKLDEPATAAEAIKAANLDWTVQKVPLYAVADDVSRRVKGHYAVVPVHKWQETDCPIFGTVGENYRALQNIEAFGWFDGIVGEGAAIYHTAGALGQGERVWILAKLPGCIQVADDDITHKYLLLSNSHDGLGSVQIRFTPVRVVCANTLGQALREQGATIRVAHTRDLNQRLALARRNLKIVDTRYALIEAAFRQMVAVKMDRARLTTYLTMVFPDPNDPEDDRAAERVYKQRQRAALLFENGAGNKLRAVAGTLWTAYNGVAELVDHAPTKRGDSARLEHIWFGSGAGVKVRAFEAAKKQMEGLWAR